MEENQIGNIIIDVAFDLQRNLGPGLLETVYEVILAQELNQKGLKVQRQLQIPIQYRDYRFEEGFWADLIVESKVLIELKSVETLTKAHAKQVLTYLKLMNLKLGYLMNFGAATMKEGTRRIVHNL